MKDGATKDRQTLLRTAMKGKISGSHSSLGLQFLASSTQLPRSQEKNGTPVMLYLETEQSSKWTLKDKYQGLGI